MSWFVFALVCLLGWGFADLFYSMGTDEKDRFSHLKLAVWVGLVMGLCSLGLLIFARPMSLSALLEGAVRYSPASLCYILSMVIGYAGIRYLEMSVISPVQNASGALSTLVMIVFWLMTGRAAEIREAFGMLDITGTGLIVCGVIALAAVEKKLAAGERRLTSQKEDRKYRLGALALIFPLLYCLFDTVGTAADGILLDGETGLQLDEIEVLILYGLTFLLAGAGCWLYMLIRTGRPYNPFQRSEGKKAIAACCEEFGQVFYVYAMSLNPLASAPMVASYCAVSVLLCRLFRKERLSTGQYACIAAVIAGIVLLGISEGLGEA